MLKFRCGGIIFFFKVVASKVGERMFKTKNELKTQSKNNNA
jgi:hypothetical protein